MRVGPIPFATNPIRWILVLNLKNPVELVSQLDNLFPSLLKMLSDANEEVLI